MNDLNAKIESCVNMASVTFAGRPFKESKDQEFTLSAGGIVGLAALNSFDVIVKNCANYGEIKQAGTSKATSLGGIVASAFLDTLFPMSKCHIENCANYGRLVHSGTQLVFLA